MHAQHSAVAQQIAQLESYSASSEQLFGTAANPHPVTGLEPTEETKAANAGAVIVYSCLEAERFFYFAVVCKCRLRDDILEITLPTSSLTHCPLTD